MSAPIHELLERSPFLEGIDRRDLTELAGHAKPVAAGPGERVFAEGGRRRQRAPGPPPAAHIHADDVEAGPRP